MYNDIKKYPELKNCYISYLDCSKICSKSIRTFEFEHCHIKFDSMPSSPRDLVLVRPSSDRACVAVSLLNRSDRYNSCQEWKTGLISCVLSCCVAEYPCMLRV